jgi:hypothetical protein
MPGHAACKILDLRPIYHRKEDRIPSPRHPLLAGVIADRIAETTTQTWLTLHEQLQRQHVITYTGPAGTFRQTTALSKPQQDIPHGVLLVQLAFDRAQLDRSHYCKRHAASGSMPFLSCGRYLFLTARLVL